MATSSLAEQYAVPGLKEKVVIITGASAGLGFATVATALASGAKVFGVDISPKPKSLQSEKNFAFLQCNLLESDSPAKVIKDCLETYGERIDALLNVAGMMDTNNSVDTLEDAAWDRIIALNLTAPVKLMREVVPVMLKQGGGSIVNVSSKAGLSGAVAGVAYTSSKHGLNGATKNVAWRFRHDGIRCNAVCPGGMNTNPEKAIDMKKMDMAAYAKLKPIHDVHLDLDNGAAKPEPELISSMMLYLASDLSVAVSGTIIPVDFAWSTI
ncbi:hypothetical protein MMC08_000585 [Hypocenomyce scalaris]|nr:hypothetical protein [Hypocenomyce scalaris]